MAGWFTRTSFCWFYCGLPWRSHVAWYSVSNRRKGFGRRIRRTRCFYRCRAAGRRCSLSSFYEFLFSGLFVVTHTKSNWNHEPVFFLGHVIDEWYVNFLPHFSLVRVHSWLPSHLTLLSFHVFPSGTEEFATCRLCTHHENNSFYVCGRSRYMHFYYDAEIFSSQSATISY